MNQIIERVFIHDCPYCGNDHVHQVMIDCANVGGRLFFAGGNDAQDEEELVALNVSLKCPSSELLVQKKIKVKIPQGSIVKTVKEISNKENSQNGKDAPDKTLASEYRNQNAINSEKEYNEWNLQSFATIRSFAERMVTLNVGSIGLMISLLTFLASQSNISFQLGMIILFISCIGIYIFSIVFFVLILFPIYMQPSNMREFISQKNQVAKRLRVFSIIAFIAYIMALTLSLVLMFLVIVL